jgi:NitT/TauT family transport system substrate-binding protein
MTRHRILGLLGITFLSAALAGCGKQDGTSSADAPPSSKAKVKLVLNWKPEPEFGGFYAADAGGLYRKHDLNVDIVGGGDQVPQMVAAGQCEFGILAADEVVTARAKGIDLVAVFAVYQTNPQGIMTHEKRGLKSIGELMAAPGKLAAQPGLPYRNFLEKKYPDRKVEIVAYDYSINQFMNDPNYSQQCFVTSEPIAAKRKGADPKVFLIAEEGFNPYAAVVVTRGDYLKQNPAAVKSFVAATAEGWRAYLDSPKAANETMAKLNTEMDADTFAAAAEAQKPLIDDERTKKDGLGTMTAERWQTLIGQLSDLKLIETAPAADDCFQNPAVMPSTTQNAAK